ncbi:MAG: carboxylesterase/lipase family protein [Alistipes sp.]|nr:carboxylesterase/lipase family protein [Alistipes senegalensis]MCM1249648.1 carboxylesterase/lipase family protein [Alistipes sp.]
MKKITLLSAILAVAAIVVGAGVMTGRDASQSGEIEASSSCGIVRTCSGLVAGYHEDGIFTFKGIPYAKAERFMPPAAPDRWEGIRSSRAYGPACPQAERAGWQSDEMAFSFAWDDGYAGEDCLRANVWTPGIADGKRRPVMVWLHGGGYSAGSGQELPSYDGANLARRGDVVVVTLNHRLNVLGFLDLSSFGEKYARSGNVGLLDLVAALQWVHDNIEAFGGDASNVTIFGQSGGGGKVSTLLATPAAAGLFHKAIVQSGSMLRTMEAKYSRRIGRATVAKLGLRASEVDKIGDVPYERLLAAGQEAVAEVQAQARTEGISSFMFGWAPTVDGEVLPRQPFDPQAPAQSKDIPMIIGTTRHEFSMTTYVPALRRATEEQAVELLRRRYGDRTDEFLEAFAAAYPDYGPKDLIDFDAVFRPGALEQGRLKAAQQGAPVYMYMFCWESPVMDGILRSTHCMEIPFVFDNVVRHASMTGGGAEARALGAKMSDAWISFARCGVPSAGGLPEWEPYDAERGATLLFDAECKMTYNHDRELIALVREFPTRGF